MYLGKASNGSAGTSRGYLLHVPRTRKTGRARDPLGEVDEFQDLPLQSQPRLDLGSLARFHSHRHRPRLNAHAVDLEVFCCSAAVSKSVFLLTASSETDYPTRLLGCYSKRQLAKENRLHFSHHQEKESSRPTRSKRVDSTHECRRRRRYYGPRNMKL